MQIGSLNITALLKLWNKSATTMITVSVTTFFYITNGKIAIWK